MPETYYRRQTRNADPIDGDASMKREQQMVDHKEDSVHGTQDSQPADNSRMTLRDQLIVPLKSLSSDFSLKILFRPWAMVLTPNILWALLA